LSEPATVSSIEFVEEINVVPVYVLDVALKPFIKVQNVQMFKGSKNSMV
jgi:hypothetical protein